MLCEQLINPPSSFKLCEAVKGLHYPCSPLSLQRYSRLPSLVDSEGPAIMLAENHKFYLPPVPLLTDCFTQYYTEQASTSLGTQS